MNTGVLQIFNAMHDYVMLRMKTHQFGSYLSHAKLRAKIKKKYQSLESRQSKKGVLNILLICLLNLHVPWH